MCNHLRTTVISPKGYVMDLTLPISKVSDVDDIEQDLVIRGYKPWPSDSDDPGDPDPNSTPPSDGDILDLHDPPWDDDVPWPWSQPSPSEPDINDDFRVIEPEYTGDGFTEEYATDPLPNDRDEDSPPLNRHGQGAGGRGSSPALIDANIIGVQVDRIKTGGNKGDPFWRIETDAALNTCIFDLDPLIRDRLITRADAMNGWREIGKRFSFPTPIPAQFRMQLNGYYDLDKVMPPPEHQEKIRASDKPTPFVPKNVRVIADIVNEPGKVRLGKTGDLDDVRITIKNSDQMARIGWDISTWDHAEPYVRRPIPVNVDENGDIQQIQAPTGAWTEARHVYKLRIGDLLYLAGEDNPCHPIAAIRKMVNGGNIRHVTFASDHPPLDLKDIVDLALTQPETPTDPVGAQHAAPNPAPNPDQHPTSVETQRAAANVSEGEPAHASP